MNMAPSLLFTGIGAGLAAAFLQSLSYFFSRRFLTECHAGSRMLFSLSLVQMGLFSAVALPFLLRRSLPPFSDFIWPLAGTTFFFLTAQWLLFILLRTTDSSIVAPLLGLKIPMLGIFSALFLGVELSAGAWLAILAFPVAAFMISPPRGIPEIRVLFMVLLICFFYSGSDLNIPVLVDRLHPVTDHPALLAVALTYIVCGLIGLFTALHQGAFKIDKGWRYAAPYSLCWLIGMCFLFLSFSLIGVIFGNMLQSTRGFISVLIGVFISGWWGMEHLESRIKIGSWLVRGCGATLMSAAIVLYYVSVAG